jgi:protein-S-isoprenylcysteine O-methyltransferase Ste14
LTTQLWLLLAAWLAYFALHSALASLAAKRWVARRHPDWMPAYRLFFNAMAGLGVLPPLALMLAWRGEPLWQWSGPWYWVSLAISALALAGFAWSLRYYDGQEFLGLRQLRGGVRSVEDQERLHISPLHRYVRHPWYFLGLLLIWTRDMDPAFLLSALAMTGYFVLGSLLEERKLMTYHGAAYLEYRRRVPGLLPLPWRHLTREQAERLLREQG